MEIESNANPVLSSSLLGPVDTNTKFTGVQFKRFTQSPNGYVAFEDGKLNKTPPSAVKSARADASLIDEVEGFLQRPIVHRASILKSLLTKENPSGCVVSCLIL